MNTCLNSFKCFIEAACADVSNDVPSSLVIYNNPSLVKKLMEKVMQAVKESSKHRSLRVTAKTYNDVVLVHVRESSGVDVLKLHKQFAPLQPIVEALGGYLDITSQRKTETTIAFSFPNLPSLN